MTKLKYPNVVYKYRNWLDPLHRNILFKNELYLSSPKDFNDPFDCRIPSNLYLLDNDQKKAKYVTRIINNNREQLSKNFNLDELLTENIKRLNDDIKSEQDRNEKIHFEQQDNDYGIISFGTKWSVNLMWAHYANFHTGFCVGFKEPNIRNEKFGWRGGNVFYTNVFPNVDPNEDTSTEKLLMESAFRETHIKEKRWGYEKEYRVVRLFEKEANITDRIVRFDNSAYESISLGLYFPESEIQCILNIAKEKQIPVYKMQKRQLSFKLYRIKIN